MERHGVLGGAVAGSAGRGGGAGGRGERGKATGLIFYASRERGEGGGSVVIQSGRGKYVVYRGVMWYMYMQYVEDTGAGVGGSGILIW